MHISMMNTVYATRLNFFAKTFFFFSAYVKIKLGSCFILGKGHAGGRHKGISQKCGAGLQIPGCFFRHVAKGIHRLDGQAQLFAEITYDTSFGTYAPEI